MSLGWSGALLGGSVSLGWSGALLGGSVSMGWSGALLGGSVSLGWSGRLSGVTSREETSSPLLVSCTRGYVEPGCRVHSKMA